MSVLSPVVFLTRLELEWCTVTALVDIIYRSAKDKHVRLQVLVSSVTDRTAWWT